jgi:hypothetical protein
MEAGGAVPAASGAVGVCDCWAEKAGWSMRSDERITAAWRGSMKTPWALLKT